ncbi:serine/arginine repetitive matrix protein 1-like, partial [Panthera uncia]|uniref:serine/arginine repetitive matrix protein 1-like n=1 Tax=Panthera uncia TaxID=29064 RepID=UPI0020FFD4FD
MVTWKPAKQRRQGHGSPTPATPAKARCERQTGGTASCPQTGSCHRCCCWDTFNRTRSLRQKRQSDRGAAGGHPAQGTPGASQPEGEDDERAPHGHSRDGGHSRYRSTNHTSSGKGNCSDDRSLSTRPPAHRTHGSPDGRATQRGCKTPPAKADRPERGTDRQTPQAPSRGLAPAPSGRGMREAGGEVLLDAHLIRTIPDPPPTGSKNVHPTPPGFKATPQSFNRHPHVREPEPRGPEPAISLQGGLFPGTVTCSDMWPFQEREQSPGPPPELLLLPSRELSATTAAAMKCIPLVLGLALVCGIQAATVPLTMDGLDLQK